MNQQKLSAERARELFSYDPETGSLTWRNPRNSLKIGAALGKSGGYCRVDLGTARYAIHRVIWLMQTGAFPVGLLDHLNGDRTDNRWANLRDCTHLVNNQNQRRAHRDSITGLLGTFPFRGRFRAAIGLPGGKKHLVGTFDTAEEAYLAYVDAKRQLHAGCTL